MCIYIYIHTYMCQILLGAEAGRDLDLLVLGSHERLGNFASQDLGAFPRGLCADSSSPRISGLCCWSFCMGKMTVSASLPDSPQTSAETAQKNDKIMACKIPYERPAGSHAASGLGRFLREGCRCWCKRLAAYADIEQGNCRMTSEAPPEPFI